MRAPGEFRFISTEQKPEVLRFAQGTDADLRLAWQEFFIRMVANAFGLPPLLLGLESDVNRSTAAELADEAFRGAILPLAQLIAGHITRDLFAKCIGWREFEFVFNDLNARDEADRTRSPGAAAPGRCADGGRSTRHAGTGAVRTERHGTGIWHLLKWINERTWAIRPHRLNSSAAIFLETGGEICDLKQWQ